MNNLILLSFFDRGYHAKQKDEHGNVITVTKKEIVKCRLWFSGKEELEAFLKEHRPIPLENVILEEHDKLREVKWMDHMTVTKDDMGVKGPWP